MRVVGRLLSVVIVLGALMALCAPVEAGAYLYSGKRKKIYCGVVELYNGAESGSKMYANANAIGYVIPTTGVGNPSFSLFAKLDSMNNLKPSGWTFENPLAMAQNKYDPDYWKVRVGSARNLSRLDMLYLPVSGSDTALTDTERENLRRFVDGGGVLWVDDVGSAPATFDTANPFFINQLQFKTGGGSPLVAVSRHHPLLCSPFWLTDVDIMSLGLSGTRVYCDMGTSFMSSTKQPTAFDVLYPIVDTAGGTKATAGEPAVVANAYGSGRLVATATGVGRACLNNEPYSLPSLKMAINIISYASTWTDLRKNPRHSGTSIDTLGSNRLVEKWVLRTDKPDEGKENAPLIYKNTVFYTSGNTLYALDQRGENQNGMWQRVDGGAVVIWKWSGPGKLSAPTITTMPNPSQNNNDTTPMEVVMVLDDAGAVHVLPAFPLNEDGSVQAISEIYTYTPTGMSGGGGSGTDGKWPSPPIYVNGYIYFLGADGRIWADNPGIKKWLGVSGNTPGTNAPLADWQYPTLGNPYQATPKCGPSFGYVKNPTSGAVVGMVYWFDSKTSIPTPATTDQNDHMCGIPVYVSMDRVKMQSKPTATTAIIQPSYFPGHLIAPDPDDDDTAIRMFESNGTTKIPCTVKLNQPTEGLITVTATGTIPNNPVIYASYALSYGPTVAPACLNVEIEPTSGVTGSGVPSSGRNTLISGTPSLGPDNVIYITASRGGTSGGGSSSGADGSILAYQNDGSSGGSNKLKWHYLLHTGVDNGYLSGVTVPGTIPGVVEGAISGTDDGTGKPLIGPMKNPQPSSSPVLSNGKLFVTVSGDEGGPQGALLCFKANSEFVVRITGSGGFDQSGNVIKKPKSLWKDDGSHYNVKIWQPNIIDAAAGSLPLIDARPISSGVDVDYDHGTITFQNFNQTKLTRMGVDVGTFSPSLPVWVWLDNVEVPIDWKTWGPGLRTGGVSSPLISASSDSVDLSGWNNLLWYYVVPDTDGQKCSGVHSPPVVIGNTVYFQTDDGVLFSLDAETGEANGKETSRKALWSQPVTGDKLDPKASVSVAGSNGTLLVPSSDGLHAFMNNPTLVADNNRVSEVDGAGEITWSVDSVSWPARVPVTNGDPLAIKQGPVNKPMRARYASTGEVLFANSGANQVCKIDRSGLVGFEGASGQYVRWIYDKFTDPKHLLRPGQPMQLRAPTDAIMWQEMEPMPGGTGANRSNGTSVVHCLIADSGNSRIVDLVYRVSGGRFVGYDQQPVNSSYLDPESGFVLPELNWVSKTDSQNEKYAYNCLQLVPAVRSGKLCQDIWVASSNFSSSGTDLPDPTKPDLARPAGGAGLGGAILSLTYRKRVSGGSSPASWDYDFDGSGAINARCDHVVIDGKTVPIANPRFLDVSEQGTVRYLLICDNYGVYQAVIDGAKEPTVDVGLWGKQYSEAVARRLEIDPNAPKVGVPDPSPIGVPLMASSVQRLPNGRWLITNSYSGSNQNGAAKFNGEVFEFDPYRPIEEAIPWSSPRLQFVADSPSIRWKQASDNTSSLRQPQSAFRQP